MKAWRLTALLRQTLCILATAFLAPLAQVQVAAAQANPNFDFGIDRRGGDYRSFDL